MKISQLAPVLLLAALVAACNKSAPDSDATVAQQFDKAKQDTAQAAQDFKNYTFAQKDEFVKKMQPELDELNTELAQLSAKIDRASDTVKAEAKPKLDALRAQVAALGVDLDQAKNATASTWDDVKAGAQKALDATTESFKEAGQWIDKQFSQ